MTDEKKEGAFEWRSGLQSTFNVSQHWYPGWGKGGRSRNCGIIANDGSGLADFVCTDNWSSVCQYKDKPGK